MPVTRIDRLISQIDELIELAKKKEDLGMASNLVRQQAALIKERKQPVRVRKTLRPGTPKAAPAAQVADLLKRQ